MNVPPCASGDRGIACCQDAHVLVQFHPPYVGPDAGPEFENLCAFHLREVEDHAGLYAEEPKPEWAAKAASDIYTVVKEYQQHP